MATTENFLIGNPEPSRFAALMVLGIMFMSMIPMISIMYSWILFLYSSLLFWRTINLLRYAKPINNLLVTMIAFSSVLITSLFLFSDLNPTHAITILMLLLACKALQAKTPGQWTNIIIMLPMIPMAVFLGTEPTWGIGYMILYTWLWIICLMLVWSTGVRLKFYIIESFKIIILSMPFIISAFLFMPRPENWLQMLEAQTSSTGMSKTVKPGDISKITDSVGIAFTATMKNLTSPADLYWRAYVMPHYNGTQWDAALDYKPVMNYIKRPSTNTIKYVISMADNKSEARPLLDYTYQLKTYNNMTLTAYGTAYNMSDEQLLYPAEASFDAQLSYVQNSDLILANNKWHPKTNNLVLDFKRNSHDVQSYIYNIEKWIVQNGFVYSKEPGKMKDDWLDTFLFERKKGFCEHYASAVTYMIRKAGYPARVVAGYQGGDYDSDLKAYKVPSAAAHAWLEYWDSKANKWTRLDPTGWVAPERLSYLGWDIINYREKLENMEGTWWSKLFNTVTQFETTWNKWVINYDRSKQSLLLKNITDLPWLQIILLVMGIVISTVLYKTKYHYRLSPDPLKVKIWMIKKYKNTPLAWEEHMTVNEWLIRLEHYNIKNSICTDWCLTFDEIVYGNNDIKTFKQKTKQLIACINQNLKILKNNNL